MAWADDSGRVLLQRVDLRGIKQVAFSNAESVATKVLAMFDERQFDVCTLYFSEFKSVINQKPTALQLIPAKVNAGTGAGPGDAVAAKSTVEYEPSEEAVLGDLLTRNISTQIFRGLLENAASEQGARMSAMDNATRNAGDMINKLTIQIGRAHV